MNLAREALFHSVNQIAIRIAVLRWQRVSSKKQATSSKTWQKMMSDAMLCSQHTAEAALDPVQLLQPLCPSSPALF